MKSSIRKLAGSVLLLTTVFASAACGGGEPESDGGSNVGSFAMTFAPSEYIAIAEVSPDDAGNDTPRIRIFGSSQPGLCDRINDGVQPAKEEKIVSFWANASAFTATHYAVDASAAKRTSGASLLDEKLMCPSSGDEVAPDRGNGQFEIKGTGAVITGSFDFIFRGGHFTGNFDAKICAKETHGVMNCTGAPASTAATGGSPK